MNTLKTNFGFHGILLHFIYVSRFKKTKKDISTPLARKTKFFLAGGGANLYQNPSFPFISLGNKWERRGAKRPLSRLRLPTFHNYSCSCEKWGGERGMQLLTLPQSILLLA
uniref:Uncharacterized protein n=1 Tax=Morchella brunnea TaxID=1174671 RepID=A0A8K1I813_9PEZI|nr:hypothetical protein LK370_mgp099 [Morchella brunnea]UBU98561.1 hypothetical protein [Morchella brunnea]